MKLSKSMLALCLIGLSLASAACGGPLKYQLRGTEISAASDANVVAALDEQRKMTELSIEATNLTPPDRLLPGATHYVVWFRKDQSAPWTRAGALELEDGNRKGQGKFTVNEIAFDLNVSPETSASPGSPSGKAVFQQRVEKK